VKEKGYGSPDHKSRAQNNVQLKEAGKPSPGFPTPQSEHIPQQEQATEGTESPETGLKDKPPLKKRRSLAFAGPRISDELLRISENKKP
jgi:hypothetical protein